MRPNRNVPWSFSSDRWQCGRTIIYRGVSAGEVGPGTERLGTFECQQGQLALGPNFNTSYCVSRGRWHLDRRVLYRSVSRGRCQWGRRVMSRGVSAGAVGIGAEQYCTVECQQGQVAVVPSSNIPLRVNRGSWQWGQNRKLPECQQGQVAVGPNTNIPCIVGRDWRQWGRTIMYRGVSAGANDSGAEL